MPIPSLIALGDVHTHLLRTRQRAKAAVFLESGDASEVHDFSLLVLGYGADAVCLSFKCRPPSFQVKKLTFRG